MAPLRWLAALTLLVACGGYSYLRDGNGTYFGIEVRDGRETPWVRGPWPVIASSVEADAIIDQLCAPLMELPAAAPPRGDYGQEYCGVIYSHEGRYYASWPAAMETPRLSAENKDFKDCRVPKKVVDERGRTAILADYHTHPWRYSPLSIQDRWKSRQRYSFRVQMDATCAVQMYIPYLEQGRPGEVYARQGRRWVLIGRVVDKASGIILPVPEGSR
ncbi:hypothetical protein D7W79_04385 [Corallococcus exercitus]|uniref:JAB domain-containing protein n=1 Tax=Corallococcus exercitus TaxID=2316736 RepID=A0A3A8IPM6_9BACT|nr:hypothetical protein [Corallococcus exercitus]NOK32547.1 hypothetical protein [Corallococcus exercitus]RKG81730.1 hypothetical protein D7W79_04385 [Corallococcus exercitus]